MSADQLRSAVESYLGKESDAYKALGKSDTDWQKEIYRLAQTYEANLSFNGQLGLGKGWKHTLSFIWWILESRRCLETF